MPASCWDACQRRGTHTCHWVYNQQILILRTRVELKYLSPELPSFKDLTIKATSPSKPLSFSNSPSAADSLSVQPLPLWLHLLIYTSELAKMSPDDESYGNYGWPICSSVLTPVLTPSLGFTQVLAKQWSDRLPLVFFFFFPFQLYLCLSLCHRSP